LSFILSGTIQFPAPATQADHTWDWTNSTFTDHHVVAGTPTKKMMA
jgi:hypothetical protein